jgi:hypothetical protein
MVTELQQRVRDGSFYESNSGCWLWMLTVSKAGYGRLTLRIGELNATNQVDRVMSAHRVSYAAFVGLIPEGMCVLHHCDTRSCVRPDHLFLDTQFINLQDRDTKGRQAKGEKHGRHVLTQDDVHWIYVYANQLNWPLRVLAECHGVNQSTMSKVLSGKTWRY